MQGASTFGDPEGAGIVACPAVRSSEGEYSGEVEESAFAFADEWTGDFGPSLHLALHLCSERHRVEFLSVIAYSARHVAVKYLKNGCSITQMSIMIFLALTIA